MARMAGLDAEPAEQTARDVDSVVVHLAEAVWRVRDLHLDDAVRAGVDAGAAATQRALPSSRNTQAGARGTGAG